MMDLSGIAVDLTDFMAIAVFLIGALITFWGIRKGLGLLDGGNSDGFTDPDNEGIRDSMFDNVAYGSDSTNYHSDG